MDFIKNKFQVTVSKNAINDAGDGVVKFSKPLVITDDSEQRNGTKYDIKSMDISEYDGMITADHSESITDIIGQTFGVTKGRSKVTIQGVKFAVKESALAQFAYDMIKGGYLRNFSIETFGLPPDESGVYHDSKLVGLSAVVLGNNRSAALNQAEMAIANNSIVHSKEMGLDTKDIERIILTNNPSQKHMEFVTVKNSKRYPVKISYKNAAEDEVEKEIQPGESVDVSEDQQEKVETQIDESTESKNSLLEKVANTLDVLATKVDALEKGHFNNSVQEPKFQKVESARIMKNLAGMGWRERHGKQIEYAWDALKSKNRGVRDLAEQKLEDINKMHVEELQKAGKVTNAMTIADFGNFVISPELLTRIEGHRSDFSSLLSRLNFRETLSLQMAWLKRDGDINMQEVEMCDDGANGNLKPISEYEADIQQSNLHELAAVTPVCNAATRFLAADMLEDIAAGYRTDFDRKRAQLFIARAQQAINSTGNTTTYGTTSDVNALKSWIEMWGYMQEEIMNGVFIFNQKTYAQLLSRAVGAGISGPLSSLFTTGEQPTILGNPFIVVPNELMPTLNTAETKSFVVEGVTVTINQAILYVDLSTFSGRTSGGLSYDLSTEAAYEVASVVKSAFQRNELILRGSFFRGGAIRDEDKVVGMGSRGVS